MKSSSSDVHLPPLFGHAMLYIEVTNEGDTDTP